MPELTDKSTNYTGTQNKPVLAKLLSAEQPVNWIPLCVGDTSRAWTTLTIAPCSHILQRCSSIEGGEECLM